MAISGFLSTALMNLLLAGALFGLNGFLLQRIAARLRFADDGMETAYTVSGYSSVVSYVLSLVPAFFGAFFATASVLTAVLVNGAFFVANAAAFVWLIERFYEEGFRRALVAWLVIIAADILALLVLGLAFGAASIL